MSEKDSSSSGGWLSDRSEDFGDHLCLCCGHELPKKENSKEYKGELPQYLDAIMTLLFDGAWHDLTSLGNDSLLGELPTQNLLAILDFLFENGFIEKQGGGLTSLKFKIGERMKEFMIAVAEVNG